MTRFSAPVGVLAGRGELAGQARPGADRVGLAGDIAPRHPGRAGVRRSGVASIRIVVVVATARAFSRRGWFRPVMAS